MSDHIEGLILSAYVDGAVTPAERASVEGHLPGCALCRGEVASLKGVKTLLSRAPRKGLPPAVAAAWGARPAWRTRLARALAVPQVWIPVGAAAAGLLSLSLWWGLGAREEEGVALEPLLAAHARCNAETLVPQNDLFNSNFSAQLAVYHPDEN